MSRMMKGIVVAGLLLTWLAMGNGYSQDEKPKSKGSKASAKASADGEAPAKKKRRIRRLPNYYGQVGVSDDQREKIYSLQEQYAEQIEALEKQLQALIKQRDEEIHNVLTDSQKTRLAELLAAAKKRAEERRAKRKAKSSK